MTMPAERPTPRTEIDVPAKTVVSNVGIFNITNECDLPISFSITPALKEHEGSHITSRPIAAAIRGSEREGGGNGN